jgi:hypothetical protein
MSEIDITWMVRSATPLDDYSASAFERGEDVARETWGNAVTEAERLLEERGFDREEIIGHFSEYGCWYDLDEWPTVNLVALLIQEAAGGLREYEHLDFYVQEAEPKDIEDALDEFEEEMERGSSLSGRVYPVKEADGWHWYLSLGV